MKRFTLSLFLLVIATYCQTNTEAINMRPSSTTGIASSTSTSSNGKTMQSLELTKPLLGNRIANRNNMKQDTSTIASTTTTTTTTTTTDDGGGTASFAASVFNLANNVAGAGLLTLAAGKATGASGWIPSIAICCTLAMASARTFILIGKSCEITGEKTFKGLWSKAFGESTAFIVDSIVFIQCFLSSTIYIGLLGDIFSALLKGTMLPPVVSSRTGVILLIGATVLFPLNLIRDLSALAFTSILGLCAVLYTVMFMIYRALDGSYSIGTGSTAASVGKFVADQMILTPTFKGSSMWNADLRSLVLVSNFGLAFIAHYNAPTYYRTMRKPSSKSFPRMVNTSYAILAMIYVTTMCAGYYTFGDTSRGNILLNYHPKDMLAFLGRLATGFSVIFGFPLVSNGAREGLKNASMALGFPAVSNPKNHVSVVLSMLIMSSILAILVSDIKVIAGFSGAAMGSFLVYMCPPLVYTNIVRKYYGEDSLEYKRGRLSLLFVPFGCFIAVMGVAMTYNSMNVV